MIFKNGFDLSSKLSEFVKNSNSLYIFVPYIKLKSLQSLIEGIKTVKAVFVRWEAKDIITKSSDLEIYQFLKSNGIYLYRNPRIHLKAYLNDYKECFLTTSNISSRALNIPEQKCYNYEIGTKIDNLSIEDRYYFSLIESESVLITDEIYNQISSDLELYMGEFKLENDLEFNIKLPDKDFLISSLPLSTNVRILTEIYFNKSSDNEVELNCALHDLALYNIPLGLPKDEFNYLLKQSFFSHKFIVSFLENLNLNGELYFGEAKEWIQLNCADVPLPRRWEITENTQILYNWICELGKEKYKRDRPNYSERIKVIN